VYICYLDESGTPEAGATTDHFVLLGLAIPANTWKQKDAEVYALKGKYGLQDCEVHTAWMLRDYPEQRTIPGFEKLDWPSRRRAVIGVRSLNLGRLRTKKQERELLKNYRKTAEFVHLTRAERQQVIGELADVIGSWADGRLFIEAQSKRHTGGSARFDFAFEQVVSRFDTFLKNSGGANGLLVQDNNQTVELKLTEAMRRFHQMGTEWTKIGHVIETPLFVDSALTSMVQMADLCAYATRRYFEKGEADLFDRVKALIDSRADGTLVGIRHFTGKHRCTCEVCVQHGRYPRNSRQTSESY
jgi:hypothetical protein